MGETPVGEGPGGRLRRQRHIVATGRLRRSYIGWGAAGGGSGGADRFRWRRILNLFLDRFV
jgi:hypothetical protein